MNKYTVKVLNSRGDMIVNTKPTSYSKAADKVVALQPKYPKGCSIVLFEDDRVIDTFIGMKGF